MIFYINIKYGVTQRKKILKRILDRFSTKKKKTLFSIECLFNPIRLLATFKLIFCAKDKNSGEFSFCTFDVHYHSGCEV